MQDNQSRSARNVLRGLHFQYKRPQDRLIRLLSGSIYDVTVDLRRASPTFGRWAGMALSADNRKQLWVPAGFAHGFVVTSDSAECLYKTTAYWDPEDEHCLLWNDPTLAIAWPLAGPPVLSAKDRKGVFDGHKPTPYLEVDPAHPLNVYGSSKLAGEQAIAAAGIDYLLIRTSWLYARQGRNFLTTIERLARERGTLRVVADQVGAPTWTRTVADATAGVLALAQAAGAPCSVDAIPTSAYPLPARRPMNSVLSSAKWMAHFAPLPAWDVELARCLAR